MGLHNEAGTHRRGGTVCPTLVGIPLVYQGGGCQSAKLKRVSSFHSGKRRDAHALRPAVRHPYPGKGPFESGVRSRLWSRAVSYL